MYSFIRKHCILIGFEDPGALWEENAANMSSEEGGPPSPKEEAPPSSGEAAPPGSEGTAAPGDEAPAAPGEEASPLEEETLLSVAGTTSVVETASLSGGGPALSGSDFLNLLPSDDDEPLGFRVRPRSAVRLGQSMLSDVSSRKSSRYRRSMSGIPNIQETLKERQVLLIIRFFKCHFNVTLLVFGGLSS